ncbi:hypothetical protein PK28_10485 [Hymenobacter sp. DG25B]|uniref:hypothetical protein n=1 Tax=Hymenobacter sp. DG25B TaxID=1385664 RepID=UPI000540BA10|nr:hypothetical protein [Hymenobacter sp. DG25B]AIZ64010.1 hypothetical protein PK28_10485 [Hymenobacter sp. DG25B]
MQEANLAFFQEFYANVTLYTVGEEATEPTAQPAVAAPAMAPTLVTPPVATPVLPVAPPFLFRLLLPPLA